MKAHCACCGQAVPDLPRLDEVAVACGLSGDAKRLFWTLAAARGRYLTCHEIAECLWGDRDDGGPEAYDVRVHVLVLRLRALLVKYPLAVESNGTGKWESARLVAWTVARPESGYGYQLAAQDRDAA